MTDPPTHRSTSPKPGSKTLPARTTPNDKHLSAATPGTCLTTRHSPTSSQTGGQISQQTDRRESNKRVGQRGRLHKRGGQISQQTNRNRREHSASYARARPSYKHGKQSNKRVGQRGRLHNNAIS
eukprot:scaffold798_cov133-Isochrysis_galbana.AAC.2